MQSSPFGCGEGVDGYLGALAGLDVADVFGKEPCFGDECFGGADFGNFLAGEEVLAGCEIVEGKDGSSAWGAEGKEFLAFDELAAFGFKGGASLLSIEAFAFPLVGGLADELFEVGFGVFSLSGGFFKIGFGEELIGEEGFGDAGLAFLADALVLAIGFLPDCLAELGRVFVFAIGIFSVAASDYPEEQRVEVFAVGFLFFQPLAVMVDLFFKGGRAELGDGLLRLEVLVFLDEKFFDKAGERRDDGRFFGSWADHGGSTDADVEVNERQGSEGRSDSRQRNPINP